MTLICWGIPSVSYDSGFTTTGKPRSCSTEAFHIPVVCSLDRTGRIPCHPLCNGHPLFVHYWEVVAPGTNLNLLLRTESQHTSVDSDYSSAQYGLKQKPEIAWCIEMKHLHLISKHLWIKVNNYKHVYM